MNKEGFKVSVFIVRETLSSKLYQSTTAEWKAEASSLRWAFRLLDERLLDDLLVGHLQLTMPGSVCAQASWKQTRSSAGYAATSQMGK